MAPPVTPSPHRFLAQSSEQSKSRATRPTAADPNPPSQSQQLLSTPVQQFKQTSRFSISTSRPTPSTPKREEGYAPQHRHGEDAVGRRPSALRRGLTRVESIEDASQETVEERNDDDEMLFGPESQEWRQETVQSIEPETEGQQRLLPPHARPADPAFDSENPTKRPRLTPNREWSQSHRLRQGTPAGLYTSKTPRFVLSSNILDPASSVVAASPAIQNTSARSRNPFLLSSTSATNSTHTSLPVSDRFDEHTDLTTPLPEHFSPHRRSQKFVPGGMADVVRGWLLGIGESSLSAESLQRQCGSRGERPQRGVATAKLHVDSLNETGDDRIKLVAGHALGPIRSQVNENEQSQRGRPLHALLVGPGKGDACVPKRGDTLKVSLPCWDIEIGQSKEQWLVSVDWDVL